MKLRPDTDINNIEKLLEKLAEKADPAAEFESRLLSNLRTRWNMLEERREIAFEKDLSEKDLQAMEPSKDGKGGGFVWGSLFSFLKKKAFGPIVALFLVVSTGGLSSYAYTSDSVTRESFLYPVKRALEKIERSLTVSTPEDEIDYTVRMMERRLAEVRHLSKKVAGTAGTGKTGDSDMLPGETSLSEAPSGPLPETLQEFSEEFDRSLQIVTVLPQETRRNEFFDRFERIVQENESFFPRRPLPSLIHEISTDTVDTVDAAPVIAPEDVPEPLNVPVLRHLEQAEKSLKLQKQIDRQIRREVRQELNRLVKSKMKSGKIENLKLPLPRVMSPEPPPSSEPKPSPEPKPKPGIDLQPSPSVPPPGKEKKIEMSSGNHERTLREEPALIVPSIREIPLILESENELRRNRGR